MSLYFLDADGIFHTKQFCNGWKCSSVAQQATLLTVHAAAKDRARGRSCWLQPQTCFSHCWTIAYFVCSLQFKKENGNNLVCWFHLLLQKKKSWQHKWLLDTSKYVVSGKVKVCLGFFLLNILLTFLWIALGKLRPEFLLLCWGNRRHLPQPNF